MLFSKSCEYALQSVIFLATKPPNSPVLQRDISTALNIPPHFLGKILQILTRHDIVSSQKGKSGGFLLKKPSSDISLYMIVEIVDGLSALDNCIIGFPGCGDDNPCPVHTDWRSTKETILQMLKNRDIGDLGQELDTKLNYIHQLKKEAFV